MWLYRSGFTSDFVQRNLQNAPRTAVEWFTKTRRNAKPLARHNTVASVTLLFIKPEKRRLLILEAELLRAYKASEFFFFFLGFSLRFSSQSQTYLTRRLPMLKHDLTFKMSHGRGDDN